MNKKLFLIAAAFLALCFVGLAYMNNSIAEQIDDALTDQIRGIEKEGYLEISYDDVTYNLLTQTMTFEDFEFTESKDFIEIGTIEFKIGLGTLRRLSESGSDAYLDDFSVTCYEMDASVDREGFEMTKGALGYSGRISMKDSDFSFRSLRIELEGLKSRSKDVPFELANFFFYADAGDNGLDLETIIDMDEETLVSLREIEIETKISDLDLPPVSTKEMELDEIGIETLLIHDLEFNCNRMGDDLTFFFGFDTDMAEASLDCAIDFSESENDPDMEIELSLNNIDRDIQRVLEKEVDWEKGRAEYEFEFDGLLSELNIAVQESLMK
jgi:hypothetical protein